MKKFKMITGLLLLSMLIIPSSIALAASSPYDSIVNLHYYNGVSGYTNVETNSTNRASVYVSSCTDPTVTIWIASYSDYAITGTQPIPAGLNANFSPCTSYPNQQICAGFGGPSGISGTKTVYGNFYYNGL